MNSEKKETNTKEEWAYHYLEKVSTSRNEARLKQDWEKQ